jgi:hypothetical protein
MTQLRLDARPSDPFRDFCQWDYTPARPAAQGDLRQAALLAAVLERLPEGARLLGLMRRIQSFWGLFNTVWGLKSAAGGPELELYFYDYARTHRRKRLTDFVHAFPDLFAAGSAVPEDLPFFMASIDIPLAHASDRIASVDLYTDGTGGTVSAGICHRWDGQSLHQKNHYRFYRSPADLRAIEADLQESQGHLPAMLRPATWAEQIYVVAQKEQGDGVYLSRLGIDQTLGLTSAMGLHPEILSALRNLRDRLTRHLFDVGVDHTLTERGTPEIRKVGLYGLL